MRTVVIDYLNLEGGYRTVEVELDISMFDGTEHEITNIIIGLMNSGKLNDIGELIEFDIIDEINYEEEDC